MPSRLPETGPPHRRRLRNDRKTDKPAHEERVKRPDQQPTQHDGCCRCLDAVGQATVSNAAVADTITNEETSSQWVLPMPRTIEAWMNDMDESRPSSIIT